MIHAAGNGHALIGVMNVFGVHFGAVRLGNFEGEEPLGGRVIGEEREIWDVKVFWCVVIFIMNGGIRDVVDWWEELGKFSFFDMVDFFIGCDSGLSIFSLGGGEDRGRGMKDSGISNGIHIGGARGRVVVAVIHGYSEEVGVGEDRRVLVKICEAR